MPARPRNRTVFRRHPGLDFLEWRDSMIAGSPFGLHTHEGYSVAVVERGATRVNCRGGLWDAGPGSVVFLPPSEPHACNPLPGADVGYRKFYFEREWFAAQAPGLAAAPPILLRDPDAAGAFGRLGSALNAGADTPLALELLRAALDALSARIPAGVRSESGPGWGPESRDADLLILSDDLPQAESQAVRLAAQLIERDPAHAPGLAELAEACGLSPSHLLRVFRQARGLTPHAYRNQLRVNLAKRLLAGGAPIAQAAAEAGFADQSHLNRLFSRYVGATPRQYSHARTGRPG